MKSLEIILDKMETLGMTASLTKCKFGFSEVTALGHVVSGLSMTIDQNKVAAILQKPLPNTILEVQQFLGFASYYRQYLCNFAAHTSSLYYLLRQGVEFNVTKERAIAW